MNLHAAQILTTGQWCVDSVTPNGEFAVAQMYNTLGNAEEMATLFAAAPELLKACRRLLATDSEEVRREARAAIAKAEDPTIVTAAKDMSPEALDAGAASELVTAEIGGMLIKAPADQIQEIAEANNLPAVPVQASESADTSQAGNYIAAIKQANDALNRCRELSRVLANMSGLLGEAVETIKSLRHDRVTLDVIDRAVGGEDAITVLRKTRRLAELIVDHAHPQNMTIGEFIDKHGCSIVQAETWAVQMARELLATMPPANDPEPRPASDAPASPAKPVAASTMAATPHHCQASRDDGDCRHAGCPQIREGEPGKTGRSCPLPWWGDDEDGPAGKPIGADSISHFKAGDRVIFTLADGMERRAQVLVPASRLKDSWTIQLSNPTAKDEEIRSIKPDVSPLVWLPARGTDGLFRYPDQSVIYPVGGNSTLWCATGHHVSYASSPEALAREIAAAGFGPALYPMPKDGRPVDDPPQSKMN